jgi:hypothetical protein
LHPKLSVIMAKIYLTISFVLFLLLPGLGQVVFFEDFDGVAGPTAGGAGTYTFPAGWLLRNVDNRTPDAAVSYVNEAWERREDFKFSVVDSAVFSTSYSSPAGQSDDWMWTPPIVIPSTGTIQLSWNAVAYDAAYRDGYEVRVMVAPDTPTGGTGVLGNQVSESDVLFSVAAENSTWTHRMADLNPYHGQTVRIAFRNNSIDKFLLLIDDVKVEVQINDDAELYSFLKTEFSQTPLNQSVGTNFSGRIRNLGANSLTNAYINATVYDSNNQEVFTSNTAPVTLVTFAISDVLPVADPFLPMAPGTYTVRYKTVAPDATDQAPGNDLGENSFTITSDMFARDRGDVVQQLGIGVGNGYLGTSFPIRGETTLSSVSVYLAGTVQVGSMKMGATVFKVQNGVPATLLYDAPEKTLGPGDSGKWHEFALSPPIDLLPGDTIVVCAKELDSTLAVGMTADIVLPKTNFVDWSSNPLPGWGFVEQYGATFAKQFMIRARFECDVDPAATDLSAGNATSVGHQASDAVRNFYVDNCTALVASVGGDGSATSISGNTTAKVWIDPAQAAHYVKRHYEITPETDPLTATGRVTLYFTQAEFDAFNILNPLALLPVNASDNSGIANLKIEKKPGTSSDGTGLPDTYASVAETINPDDADITWNPDASRWEVSFPVSGFSGFFIKTQIEPLPVRLISFQGKHEGRTVRLQWETAEEVNASHFEIERSANGKQFLPIGKVPARNTAKQHYQYADPAGLDGTSYYRLKMVDLDQTFAYSRIVALASHDVKELVVYPNPAREMVWLQNTGPELLGTEASVIDMDGRIVNRFMINEMKQKISVRKLPSGTYLIRFGNGQVGRFVKE